MTDPLLRMLANLPPAEIDTVRADRVRLRCRARLVRRRPRRVTPATGVARFWAPLVAGLGGLYFTEVIRQVLRFYGVL